MDLVEFWDITVFPFRPEFLKAVSKRHYRNENWSSNIFQVKPKHPFSALSIHPVIMPTFTDITEWSDTWLTKSLDDNDKLGIAKKKAEERVCWAQERAKREAKEPAQIEGDNGRLSIFAQSRALNQRCLRHG